MASSPTTVAFAVRARETFLYPKAFYFFYYAALASFQPYLILHYQSLGLSSRQIGLLAGLIPFITLLSAPLWSEIADVSGKHRRLLLSAISTALFAVALLSGATLFPALLLIMATYAFAVAPIMPLVDNAVLEALGDRRHDYGKQRLWGAVGWGLSAPLVGWVTQQTGLHWAFYGYLLLMLCCFAVSTRLPMGAGGIARPFGQGLTLLRDRRWLLFLFAGLSCSVSLSVIGSFLPLYLNDLGGSRTLLGFSLSIATISEMPVMFFAGYLLSRWGARALLSFSLGMVILRLLAYSFVTDPTFILPIGLLHGFTFGLMWISGVSYAKELAPPEAGTAAQGLFTGVTIGLGGTLGALIGGTLYDAVGGVIMFRLVAALVGLGLVLLLLGSRKS